MLCEEDIDEWINKKTERDQHIEKGEQDKVVVQYQKTEEGNRVEEKVGGGQKTGDQITFTETASACGI